MMKKVVVVLLLGLALSGGCAAAHVSSCDAGAARTDCGKYNPRIFKNSRCVLIVSGYLGINESACEAKGCCWSPENVRFNSAKIAEIIFEVLCKCRTDRGASTRMRRTPVAFARKMHREPTAVRSVSTHVAC